MIRTKDIKMISQALDYAHKNKLDRGYTIVAFLVRSKNIVSIGTNHYIKTHSNTPQIENYIIPSHAEVKCISKWIVKNRSITSDMSLYIVGLTQGKLCRPVVSSKPCDSCQKFIKTVGIPRVVYFDYSEDELNIKEMVV